MLILVSRALHKSVSSVPPRCIPPLSLCQPNELFQFPQLPTPPTSLSQAVVFSACREPLAALCPPSERPPPFWPHCQWGGWWVFISLTGCVTGQKD